MSRRRTFTWGQPDRAACVLLAQDSGNAVEAATEIQSASLPEDVPVAMSGGVVFAWEPGEWTVDAQISIAILATAEASGDDLAHLLHENATGRAGPAR